MEDKKNNIQDNIEKTESESTPDETVTASSENPPAEASSLQGETDAEKTVEQSPDLPTPPIAPQQTEAYAFRWDYTEQNLYDSNKKDGSDIRGVRNFAIIMSTAFLLAILSLFAVLLIKIPSGLSGGAGGASLEALYDECYPSYVAISAISDTGGGTGSGIIMTSDGYIATNYHVVEGATKINVILHTGNTVEAEYIDGDELNDIAIIKVNQRGLRPATIGKSSKAQVGEQVMAIGTPYSIQYRGTMTSGYISALDRKYAAKNENGTVNKVITLLQTDTSVNPGNSGGPLFNMDGEVIGIVSMKIAGSEYEGMGFAIPIDGVIDMLWDIINNGELTISNGGSAYEGAALGITAQTVVKGTTYFHSGDSIFLVRTTESGEEQVVYETIYGERIYIPIWDVEMLEEYGIADYSLYTAPESGCRVISISPGFDAAIHLQPDDIILKVNDITCEYKETLTEIISNSRVGDKLKLEVWRNNEILWLSITLGQSSSLK